ncbi:MAG TPA: ABC transporter substrate-binding protein [Rhizomicrobium sp.]|nr:ABC transporter substrate-binding protein [Rhizomicrobium sp.]
MFFINSAAAAPRRVVSTYLCTDEYVFRLVPRGHIAALSFEAGDRSPVVSTIADKVGGIAQIRPSTETVLNFHPDLVVMYAGTMARLHTSLAALGVPILEVPWDNSLADIRKTTRLLGAALGAPQAAEAMLAGMDSALAAARRAAPQPSVRTLIYEPNGYATAGGVMRELMTAAGLSDAAPSYAATRTGTVPVEEVIAAAPELLILSGREQARNTRADLVLHHPALASLAGRTYSAWAPLVPLLCPGPWSAAAAQTFAALGHKARLLAPAQGTN